MTLISDSMVDAQTVGVLVTAASVTVAAIYYMITLRNNQRNLKTSLDTRQAQLLMNVYSKYTDPIYIQSYKQAIANMNWSNPEDYVKKYPPMSPESMAVELVFNYYEGIGVLVEEGLLDVELVAKLMSGHIIPLWEKYSPLILEARKQRGTPRVDDKTEYLYNMLRRVRPTEFSYVDDATVLYNK